MSGKLTKAQLTTLQRLAGKRGFGQPRFWRSLCDKLTVMGLAEWKGPGPHEYEITALGRTAIKQESET